MDNAKRKVIRKFLFALIYLILASMFIIGCAYIVKEKVLLNNTWQYNATYDFNYQPVKKENDEVVMEINVETPAQLAGALNVTNNLFSKDVKLKRPELFTQLYMDHTDSDISHTVSYVIYVINNIDFDNFGYTWYPTSIASNVTLEGNGMNLNNLYISNDYEYNGFTTICEGTIQNLIFNNLSVESTRDYYYNLYLGGVTGWLTTTGYIKNVSILGSSSVTASENYDDETDYDRFVGGICGYNSNDILYCKNEATITYGRIVGGIAGGTYSEGLIEYCNNYGTIYQNSEMAANPLVEVGGIVGYVNSGTTSLCVNYGDVTGEAYNDLYIGGIVGWSEGPIYRSGNYGNISTTSIQDVAYAGGIAGFNRTTLAYCFNRGNIDASAYKRTWGETSIYTDEICYATGVGPWWVWNNYVVDGIRSDGGYYTGYKKSSGYYSGRNVYAGGITAYTSGNVNYCYTTGSVTQHVVDYIYHIHVKQASQHRSDTYGLNQLILTHISYQYLFNSDSVIGFEDSNGGHSYCYYTDNAKVGDHYRNISGYIQFYNPDTSYSYNFSDWIDDWWTSKDSSKYVYNTRFGYNLSSISTIELTAKYHKNEKRDTVVYKSLSTGISDTTVYTYGINDDTITSSDLGSEWTEDTSDNTSKFGGMPYPKGLFWDD